MTLARSTWEHNLLSLAQRAEEHAHSGWRADAPAAAAQLEQAYAYCTSLTRVHSRSFYLASGLLPSGQREAVRALYAFCRVSDDLVDHGTGDVRGHLEVWRQRVMGNEAESNDPVVLAWNDARHRYHIPGHFAHQLLDGVARDLDQTRYDTFTELTTYCYSVASTVGLMSMHVVGFSGRQAMPYAIKLGVALQLTNILRDVAEDYANGRIYLPREELTAFGLDEGDIADGVVTDRWRAFMRFQIIRNHRLYEEAWPGIPMLARGGRFAIGAAAELYRGILDDIVAHDYDVFSRRAHVSTTGKLRRLPRIWWRTRRPGATAPQLLPVSIDA